MSVSGWREGACPEQSEPVRDAQGGRVPREGGDEVRRGLRTNVKFVVGWADWDWVEELLYLSMAAMEACVIYPWYLLFNALSEDAELAPSGRSLSLWGMCVLVWIPYVAARLLNRSRLTLDRRQALVVGLMILTALVTVRLYVYSDVGLGDLEWVAEFTERLFSAFSRFPIDLAFMALVLIGWWRGIVLSRKEYDTQRVGFHFRLGIVVFMSYFMVTILGQRVNAVPAVLAYFFFGLMSIALARILEVGGIYSSSLGSRQWVAVLVGSSLGSLALALLFSLLFSRQVLQAFLAWTRPIWRALLRIAWYVAGVLLYLLFPLVEWAIALFRRLRSSFGVGQEGLFMSPLVDPLEAMRAEERPEWLPYCHTILMVLAVVGGLFLVARLIRRIAAEQARRKELERESVWSGQDFAHDLRNSLQQGWEQVKAFLGQLGDRRHRSAASVRKLYASMVDLATEAGYGRRAAETPYEYRSTLYRAFAGAVAGAAARAGEGGAGIWRSQPGGGEAVDAITEAYVRVHYGEVPSTQAEMDRLVQYWEQLQRLIVGGGGTSSEGNRVRKEDAYGTPRQGHGTDPAQGDQARAF